VAFPSLAVSSNGKAQAGVRQWDLPLTLSLPDFGNFILCVRAPRSMSVSPELDHFFLVKRCTGERWPSADQAIELPGRWQQHPPSKGHRPLGILAGNLRAREARAAR
jgi:hypothetical protein